MATKKNPFSTFKPGIHVFKRQFTASEPYRPKRTVYEYWWNIVTSNGRIIARSSEMYRSKTVCIKSIHIAANILHPVVAGGGFGNFYYDHTGKKTVIGQFK